MKFVPKGPINNILALVQKMAWRRPGDKPLSEPMMISLLTHICVIRPQWVKQGPVFVKKNCALFIQSFWLSVIHFVNLVERMSMAYCPIRCSKRLSLDNILGKNRDRNTIPYTNHLMLSTYWRHIITSARKGSNTISRTSEYGLHPHNICIWIWICICIFIRMYP